MKQISHNFFKIIISKYHLINIRNITEKSIQIKLTNISFTNIKNLYDHTSTLILHIF